MLRIYPPNDPKPVRLHHSQLQPGPGLHAETGEAPAPRTAMSIVAVTTLGNAMYAFSNVGDCWRITVNPFEIYQLYAAA